MKYALELGYPMIDTAEMYGDGGAEEIVGEAIAGARHAAVHRQQGLSAQRHARSGTIAACERSLKRMGIERIDLYLLHWRGGARARGDLRGVPPPARGGKDRRFRRQQLRHATTWKTRRASTRA